MGASMVTREGGHLAKLGGHSNLTWGGFIRQEGERGASGRGGGEEGEEEMRKSEKLRREL